jgi:hypothetical protein
VCSPQDLEAMRLFLFDCSDVASSSSIYNNVMLRLRRSTSAQAPDVSLGVIAIFCSIVDARLPVPVMDVDRVGAVLYQCSYLQRQSTVL